MSKILAVIILLFVESIFTQSEIYFPSDGTGSNVQNFGSCFTPIRERGFCIYLEACGPLYNLLQQKPLREDDKLFLRRSQCGYNNGQVLVCCSRNQITPPTRQPNIGNQGVTTNSRGLLPAPGVCGNVFTNRIYGGNRTAIDEFPWMALLEYTKPENRKGFHCGGSLISNRYVLTASHCVAKESLPANWDLTGVRLGEWDLSTEEDCERDSSGSMDCADPYVDVAVERIVRHENYMPGSKNQNNDIALLRLARSVPYTDFIRPICIPIKSQLRNSNFNGVKMDIAGWGRTESASTSEVKLKTTVTGVNLGECNMVYNTRNVMLTDTQICAGGVKGIDSCRGDSGGPLIGLDRTATNDVYYFLVGIVSFGPTPCGLEGWPGVYTRVGAFADWVEKNIEP